MLSCAWCSERTHTLCVHHVYTASCVATATATARVHLYDDDILHIMCSTDHLKYSVTASVSRVAKMLHCCTVLHSADRSTCVAVHTVTG
jgi:hypothetical protein